MKTYVFGSKRRLRVVYLRGRVLSQYLVVLWFWNLHSYIKHLPNVIVFQPVRAEVSHTVTISENNFPNLLRSLNRNGRISIIRFHCHFTINFKTGCSQPLSNVLAAFVQFWQSVKIQGDSAWIIYVYTSRRNKKRTDVQEFTPPAPRWPKHVAIWSWRNFRKRQTFRI